MIDAFLPNDCSFVQNFNSDAARFSNLEPTGKQDLELQIYETLNKSQISVSYKEKTSLLGLVKLDFFTVLSCQNTHYRCLSEYSEITPNKASATRANSCNT